MFRDRLDTIDGSLLDLVETQTSVHDRRSLLPLHAGVADRLGELSYLEIGSSQGGSGKR